LIFNESVFMFGKKLSNQVRIKDFPDIVRGLLISGENGAITKVEDKESGNWFSFERVSGSDTSAVLALRIPRRQRTTGLETELEEVYRAQGFRFSTDNSNISLLGRVVIPIEDIWNKSSGAEGAHAAHLLLNAIGVAANARFKVHDLGPVSMRALGKGHTHRVNQ